MKTIIIHIIFVKLLVVTFSVVLDWDFQNSAINLFSNGNEHINNIYNKNKFDMKVKLEQKITLQDSGTPKLEKKLYIDDIFKCNVDFDDIESHYYFQAEGDRFICPKGSYHMKIVKDNSLEDVIPSGFPTNSEKNWELKCYYKEPYIFVIYRSQFNALYARKITETNWNGNHRFYDTIYDFKCSSQKEGDIYPMTFIALNDQDINLIGSKFTVKDSSFNREDIKDKKK